MKNTFLKSILFYIYILPAILISFGLKANESVVFNKVVSSNSATSSSVTNVQNLSGSNFKFTSLNSTFASSRTSNNVSGTLTYFNASNVLVSVSGKVKGKTTRTGNTTSLYFENTGATTFYLLVIPGKESDADFVNNTSPNFNSSGPDAALDALLTTQTSASTTTTSKSVVVSLNSPAGVTESNSSYVVFTLTFSTSRSTSSQTVSFSPSITDISTTTGSDYTNSIEYSTTSSSTEFSVVSGSLSVAYTTNTIYLRVPLKDDLLPESNETFNLSTGAFSGAGIGELANDQTGAIGTGTILDDSDPYLWTGRTSTTWSIASNWNAGATPGSSDNAKIPQSGITNFPVLGANASINSLEIVSGASVNTSASKLTVNGSLINNGTILGDDGSGKLAMAGSSSQTMTGTGSIDNLEINNSNGVSISSGSTMTLKSGFYPVVGILTTNGGLVLNSDANGTASVFQKPSSCTTYISGDVIVNRYINPNGNNSYRFIGNPFNDATKLFSSFSNLPLSKAYKYNSSYATPNPSNSSGDPAWASVSGADTFEKFRGIISFIDVGSAFTIQATGPINQCDVVVSVSSYSNNDANKGYVLLSNPYASFLDLSANTTRTNVQNGFYVWDTATASTDVGSQKSSQSAYNAKGKYKSLVPGAPVDVTLVPPMGAFFVQLSAGAGSQSGSITFKETEKSNSRNAQYYAPFSLKPNPGKAQAAPLMNLTVAPSTIPFYFLKLRQNGQEIDDFKLVFRPEATNDYDNWDLTKMPNSNLDLYAKLPNSTYNFAVDTRSNEFKDFEIPIYLTAKDNISEENFELKWEHYNEVDADFILEDVQSHEKFKLINGKSYSFKGGSKTPESPRFNIYVIRKGIVDEVNVNVYPNPANKYIQIQGNDVLKGEYTISIFDDNGFKVLENIKSFSGDLAPSILTENLIPGNYFIHIKNSNGFLITKKLLIK